MRTDEGSAPESRGAETMDKVWPLQGPDSYPHPLRLSLWRPSPESPRRSGFEQGIDYRTDLPEKQ
eukprot:9498839-Pyramimonas_sp.AAC.1